jgi:hypothetical protein
MGGGLYLHNWLHSNNCKQASSSTGTIVTSYNCSCIDDFSIPFTADPNPVIEKSSSLQAEFISFYRSLVPFSSPSFNAERGPPCFS